MFFRVSRLVTSIIFFVGVYQVAQASFSFQTYQNRNSPDFTFIDSTRDDTEIEENPVLHSLIFQNFSNPISYDQAEDGNGSLVSNLLGVNIASEYNWRTSSSIGLELSLNQLDYFNQGRRFGFGDLRLFSKNKLRESSSEEHFKVSIVPSVYFPTGNHDLLLSNSNGGAGANLLIERHLGTLLAAINLGADDFPQASQSNINYEFQTFIGAGIKHSVSDKWSLQAEWLGRKIRDIKTGDLYGGGQYNISADRQVFAGASLASTALDGAGLQYRVMLGFRWLPASHKLIIREVHTTVETIHKINTVHDCGPKVHSKIFTARALNENEKQFFAQRKMLPYLSTSHHPISTLRLGGKNAITPEGLPYVKDAQILFAFDLVGLPRRQTVISIQTLDLSMKVNKFWSSESPKTDMICFLTEKICSGDLYDQKERKENINQAFFANKEPPNDYFMRQISNLNLPAAPSPVSRLQLNLPLLRLIENAVFPDPSQLLYSDTPGLNGETFKTLYFAVAHDVHVTKNVQLKVELNAETCADNSPPPTTETHEDQSKANESEIIIHDK